MIFILYTTNVQLEVLLIRLTKKIFRPKSEKACSRVGNKPFINFPHKNPKIPKVQVFLISDPDKFYQGALALAY